MRPPLADDRGVTLVELLVTVVILGITAAAVLGGLLTSVRTSDVHRKQTTAGVAARAYAENIARHVAGSGYVACAAPASYAPATVGFPSPAGYAAEVASIRYWPGTGTGWTSTCSADSGLQQVTVEVRSDDARATERSVVIVRKPCGIGSAC